MSISVCPIATVDAPAETVWSLLSNPSAYASWWEAVTDSITPAGLAHPGQIVRAHSRALGMNWKVRVEVDGIDFDNRELNLTTHLPPGITIRNHIVVRVVDEHRCMVSFG